jgi:prepilin signal peptidase PulO-like enzyme (type II secretory pathway)
LFFLGFIIAAFLGLAAGFIINVIATRLAADHALWGGLRCTGSPHPLTFRQYVPLFGFLIQRGSCSTCGKRLPVSFPLTELVMALLLMTLYAIEGWSVSFLFHALYVSALMLVLVIDWKHKDIYFSVIAFGSAVALVGSFLLPGVGLLSALIGAAVAGGFFLFAFLLAKLLFPRIEEPLGAGDVLLALMMGLMLGFPNVVGALLIGPLIAGVAVGLLLLSRRHKLGDFIPYGVALCAATILFLVYPAPFADALKLPNLMIFLSSLFG